MSTAITQQTQAHQGLETIIAQAFSISISIVIALVFLGFSLYLVSIYKKIDITERTRPIWLIRLLALPAFIDLAIAIYFSTLNPETLASTLHYLLPFSNALFYLVIGWLTLPNAIPTSLKKHYTESSQSRAIQALRHTGLMYMVVKTMTFVLGIIMAIHYMNTLPTASDISLQNNLPYLIVSILMILLAISNFILFIMYWFKAYQFKKRFMNT